MVKKAAIHEDYGRKEAIKTGSDRSFGIVFAVVFTVIGLWPLAGGGDVRLWALGVGSAFALAALVAPASLKPFNRLWFRFGLLLHRVVNPLVMGLLFFVTITPMAWGLRLLGKDPLKRRFDPNVATYWIERRPPGPEPKSMKYQF